LYKKQNENKACSIKDGPNCYQLDSADDVIDNEYLAKAMKKLKYNTDVISVEIVANYLNKELQKFKEKYKASMNEVFKFTPKIMMNLLLNFESFDQTTKHKDVYMPEEKIVNFNVGYIKLNFKGKLRLTQDKDNMMKSGAKNVDGYPAATYGVIEDRDLFIKFDKPVIIKHLYIRPHYTKETKYRTQEMSVVGYKNEQVVFSTKMHLVANNRDWYKITPSQSIIDTIRLPKDFDVDDISISHDSEYSDNQEDNGQLTSILQTVIDELVEKSNKNQVKDDDL